MLCRAHYRFARSVFSLSLRRFSKEPEAEEKMKDLKIGLKLRDLKGGADGGKNQLVVSVEDKQKIKEPRIELASKDVKSVESGKDQPVMPPKPPSFYMDTHNVVVELQRAGYSTQQAEVLVEVLVEVLRNSLGAMETSVLSRQDLALLEVRMQRELEKVAGKLVLLEYTTLESLRNENGELKDKVEKLMSRFKEEVTKVQSNLHLDLNLEKGRIKEEATVLLQQIKDTNNRIDKEVAEIRTHMESQKLESIKYLAGVSFSVVTVVLSVMMGVWRLMK